MAEFLLEIFSEEIPARMQAKAADDLHRMVTEGLRKNGLAFDDARSFVTPRRLVLVIEGLPEATPDIDEEKRGPRVGAPEQALDGFLKAAGVSRDQLEERDTGKGVFYFAIIKRPGRQTADMLKDVVDSALADFPWPKSMRWGSHAMRWVRPLHSILSLFAGKVVPVSFGPVIGANVARGHRFLAPDAFTVTDFADYAAKLAKAHVVLDPIERRQTILSGAERLAAAEGLTLRQDDGLLAEVTGLVEYPVMLMGRIDESFMDVPAEVLITSMRSHQKYFSCLNKDGSLAPRFILAANMVASDEGRAIVAGNERVLRARLSDAKFFWDTDRRQPLESRLPKLEERLFYAGLGSVADKVRRMEFLAKHLTYYVDAPVDLAQRAARLAKADLSTEMVGEFPELQGLMGRYYAAMEDEDEAVAEAISDHYSPLGPSDDCPTAPVSVVVSLADKVDTLVGFFAIDEKPTGSKDPFALRRAALGVIRLIVENGLRIPLMPFFEVAHSLLPRVNGPGIAHGEVFTNFPGLVEQVHQSNLYLLDFFADRLKVHLKEEGVRHDLVTAIFALGGEDDLVRLLARVHALADFLASEDGANLLIAYRRAANIVRIEEKKDGVSYDGTVIADKLVEPEEQALASSLVKALEELGPALKAENFSAAMEALATLRGPVDSFFDKVTVNADDADLRVNRLRLLSRIGATMGRVADFSKVEG